MPETWVHGSAFTPRLYGPEFLLPIGGIAGTEQGGIKDAFGARFNLRAERLNSFSAPIPVAGSPQLSQVVIEVMFGAYQAVATDAYEPDLTEVIVFAGLNHVARTRNPVISGVNGVGPSAYRSVTVENINQPVSRGLCVSVEFSTVRLGANFIGPGEVRFSSVGVIFS
jgi:hypothetical protein